MANEWRFKNTATFTGDFLPKLMPHHRQGTLDGACGFYCVSMILDYFDVCDPSTHARNSRTRLAQFLDSFDSRPLLTNGLTVPEVRSVAKYFGSVQLRDQFIAVADFWSLRKSILELSGQAIPAILRFRYQGMKPNDGHYAITTGTGQNSIYLMDPAIDAPEGALYNNFLRAYRKDSIFDQGGSRVIDLGPCVAIWPTGFRTDSDELWGPAN